MHTQYGQDEVDELTTLGITVNTVNTGGKIRGKIRGKSGVKDDRGHDDTNDDDDDNDIMTQG